MRVIQKLLGQKWIYQTCHKAIFQLMQPQILLLRLLLYKQQTSNSEYRRKSILLEFQLCPKFSVGVVLEQRKLVLKRYTLKQNSLLFRWTSWASSIKHLYFKWLRSTLMGNSIKRINCLIHFSTVKIQQEHTIWWRLS